MKAPYLFSSTPSESFFCQFPISTFIIGIILLWSQLLINFCTRGERERCGQTDSDLPLWEQLTTNNLDPSGFVQK